MIVKNLNSGKWLVTGGAGFIGSNIIEELLKTEQEVVSIDNFSTGFQHNLDMIRESVDEDQWKRFTFIRGDIRDFQTCLRVTSGIDIILHQAALGSVPRSISDPLSTNDSNVTGFLNLLQAAKNNKVEKFVFASSSSIYGDNEELPKIEGNTGLPLSPYAVSKMADELYARIFHSCYGLKTIGLRYFNVFGKRQDPEGSYSAVIPRWYRQILNNEKVVIFGDGETSRDFTYIENVVQANILAGLTENTNTYGQFFNVAGGGRTTLNNLLNIIMQSLKDFMPELNIPEISHEGFRKGDIRHSYADISKIKNMMGFKPTHNLQQGINLYTPWFINHLKR